MHIKPTVKITLEQRRGVYVGCYYASAFCSSHCASAVAIIAVVLLAYFIGIEILEIIRVFKDHEA